MSPRLNSLLTALFPLLLFAIPHTMAGFCPRGCYCDDERLRVGCRGAGLKSVPILLNPRIRSLDLAGNAIESVGRDELSFYKELQSLDLSNNGVASVERGAFFQLAELETLNLAGNLLRNVGLDSFAGLAKLKVLDLSGNELTNVGAAVFSDLAELELLNLTSNSLRRLSADSLSGLSSLTELLLADNELSDAPAAALRHLTGLRILNLASNRLASVDNESFVAMHLLEVLDLSENRLDSLHANSFLGLHNLRALSLRANTLYRVPTMALRVLTELQALDLSQNQIQELATSSFDGLARLRSLVINGCPLLHTVQLNAFSGLYSLETLDMSRNPSLAHISPLAFERPAQSLAAGPRSLSLAGCGLRSLPAELVDWDALVRLDLGGNPWLCDCGVAWLPAVLNKLKGNGDAVDQPKCTGPAELHDRPLASLTSADFAQCYDNQTTRMVIHLAALFSSLLLLTVVVLVVIKCIDRSPDCLYFLCARCCCCADNGSPSAGARSLTASSDNDSASALYNGLGHNASATLRHAYEQQACCNNNKSASLGSRAELVYSPAAYAAYQHQYCSTPVNCQSDAQRRQAAAQCGRDEPPQSVVVGGVRSQRPLHPPPFLPPPPPPLDALPPLSQQQAPTGGYYCSIPPANGLPPYPYGGTLGNGAGGRRPTVQQLGRSPSADSGNFRVLSKYPVPITEL